MTVLTTPSPQTIEEKQAFVDEWKHHHHFYDEFDNPAILVHAHVYTNVRHVTASIPDGMPVYWDHEGGSAECMGLLENP